MRIQVERYVSESGNGKSIKYEFYHPSTLRRCFAWFPVSQIKHFANNEIQIPNWLWESIKKQVA
jgi:hypothetical protein